MNDPGHGLDEGRVAAVEKFCDEDPVVRRFLLIFDALRLRGVERTQAARTGHLLASGSMPGDSGPTRAE